MENQPQTPPQPPQQPSLAQQQPLAAAAPAASQQTAPAGTAPSTPQPARPGVPLPKDQAKSNKRLLLGCVTAFGCSLLLFLAVLFGFIAFGDTNNPIFGFLGVPAAEVINVLITLVNLIFLVLVFFTFVLVIVGAFRIAAAKKEDKEGKRKAAMFTFGTLAFLALFSFLWIVAYFFLAPKRTTTAARTPIVTEPEKTTNLTAPVTVKFDASKAPINKKFRILSYAWDFGDGKSASGMIQTHTYTDLGNYKVTLSVLAKEIATNKDATETFTTDVTISNVLAKVIINADKTNGEAPLTVSLDGSESSSQNGEITAYAWDLDGDKEFDDSSSKTASATFDKIGSYTIGLRVQDSTGAFATGEETIEIKASDDPVPVIEVEGVTGDTLEKGRSYVFSAAKSESPAGTIEKFHWEFGDGGKSDTRTATYIYKEVGEYEVVLAVIDSTKQKAEISKRFKVTEPSSTPIAAIFSNPPAKDGVISGSAPFTVSFDGGKSQDPNNNIIEYLWDFNADAKTDAAEAKTMFTFVDSGKHEVTLTVRDADNLENTTVVTVQVESAGLSAQIKAEPVSGTVPLTVRFDASSSTYIDGSIVAYEWEFGDATPKQTDAATVSHQYTAVGSFTAKVIVIAADAKRASATVPITVRPVSLNACFEATPSKGKLPLSVQFDPTCSTGTVTKYRWNFAGITQSSERKPTFNFTTAGSFEVTLEVSDNNSNVDTFKKTITVTP